MVKKMIRGKNAQAGFTLVEIAIVMVIIGLLIGGVLKGQAMVQNAKVKRLVSDIDKMRAAVITYQDKFGMFPGDENDANAPTGDGFSGDNDGLFDEADGQEISDMRYAGILAGAGGDLTLLKNPFGGTMRVDYIGIGGLTANFIYSTTIPAEICQEIDSKYDDGVWNTGEIRGSAAYTADTVRNLGWRL